MNGNKEEREIVDSLKRIERTLSALLRASAATQFQHEVIDKKFTHLYELTGTIPIKAIAKKTGFSAGKISGIWRDWERVGLLTKDGSQYRKEI